LLLAADIDGEDDDDDDDEEDEEEGDAIDDSEVGLSYLQKSGLEVMYYDWCIGEIIVEVLFCSLAVLDPRVDHTMDVISPFIPVLCHSDRLFHGESCPRLDVVHPGRAWPSSPSCTWHCSLHYIFLQTTPLFLHGVTIVEVD